MDNDGTEGKKKWDKTWREKEKNDPEKHKKLLERKKRHRDKLKNDPERKARELEKRKARDERYRNSHREELSVKRKTIYKDVIKKQKERYYEKNSEFVKQKASEFKKNNRAYVNFETFCRKSAVKRATPSWVQGHIKDQIAACYEIAISMELLREEEHQVDHIFPINPGAHVKEDDTWNETCPDICGLHIPRNLDVITKEENNKKKNKFNRDDWVNYNLPLHRKVPGYNDIKI